MFVEHVSEVTRVLQMSVHRMSPFALHYRVRAANRKVFRDARMHTNRSKTSRSCISARTGTIKALNHHTTNVPNLTDVLQYIL